ncbi:MAG: TasA family protein [Acidimicrobiales bacterium]
MQSTQLAGGRLHNSDKEVISMTATEQMTADQPVDEEERRGGTAARLLATFAVLALAGGAFTIASLALFTDQEAVAGNAFSTGTVDLLATPATAVVTAPAMAPGDQVTAPLDIANSGTLELRYSATSTTTEDTLASELVLTIKSGVSVCDDANWTADGAVEYAGVLGTTGTSAIWGSPVQGTQAGDRVLAAGANEVFCVNVTLPLAATNASQGVTTTATFTFDAEQTANNP